MGESEAEVPTLGPCFSLPPSLCLLSRKPAFMWHHEERNEPTVWPKGQAATPKPGGHSS